MLHLTFELILKVETFKGLFESSTSVYAPYLVHAGHYKMGDMILAFIILFCYWYGVPHESEQGNTGLLITLLVSHNIINDIHS